jgi:hypothetical protein
MGESHYSKEEPEIDWTIQAVLNLALQKNSDGAFWTKAIQTVENTPSWELDRASAWNRVAFSNFLQSKLTAPKDPIPEFYWEEARNAFFAQLAITRPTVLVALGVRLFSQLPNEGKPIPYKLDCGDGGPFVEGAWLYEYMTDIGPHRTVSISVFHPSSFGKFKWQDAARRVNAARRSYAEIIEADDAGDF